jgi:uncharacterized protein
MWSAWQGPGLGHLRLAVRESGVVADGLVLGVADGRTVSYLQGSEYVDISETPFTNSLPIRRLGLVPGGSAELTVAYLERADRQPWPEPQRYTRLETGDGGGTYRFVSLDGGFSADLPVDLDGLVLDYPGLFRRAFP